MVAVMREPPEPIRTVPGPKGGLLLGNTVEFQKDPLASPRTSVTER